MDARRKLQAKRKLVSCGRSGRVEERFRASVEKGNYYEAHQTLRALYQRYIAQGKDQNAWNFLRQGCLLLIKKDQVLLECNIEYSWGDWNLIGRIP